MRKAPFLFCLFSFLLFIQLNARGQTLEYLKHVFPPDLATENVVIHTVSDRVSEKIINENDTTWDHGVTISESEKVTFIISRQAEINQLINDFVARCKTELFLNYVHQPNIPLWTVGELNPAYDTSQFKYALRHHWIADLVSNTYYDSNTGTWSSSTPTWKYFPVFYFYDLKNGVKYDYFARYCEFTYPYKKDAYETLTNKQTHYILTAQLFFESLYEFTEHCQAKGTVYAYQKRLKEQYKMCRGW
jgi:hypothetical protein